MTRLLALAARNLLRHGRRTVVLGLAIALGVVGLLAIASLSQGVLAFFAAELAESRTGAVQVHRRGYLRAAQGLPLGKSLPDDEAFRARLRAVEGVRAVSARLVFAAQVGNGRRQATVLAQGLEVDREALVCPRALEGRLAELRPDGVFLGGGLARAMGAAAGDEVTLSASSPGGRGNAVEATVAGTVGGFYALDTAHTAALPLAQAQSLTGMQGQVTEYAIALEAPHTPEAVAARLRAALGPDVEVHTWSELSPFLRDALWYMGVLVLFAGLLLSVVVAAGITNVMTMSVLERTREIGTQLAVGLRRRDIRLLFLFEAGVLGLVAAALGVALGAALVTLVGAVGIPGRYFGFSGDGAVRPAVDLAVALFASLGATAAAVIAAVVPAARAARLSPAEALRGRSST